MAIIENGLFPKLSGEDARIFKERAEARKIGANSEELRKIKDGLKEALEFFSGASETRKGQPSE